MTHDDRKHSRKAISVVQLPQMGLSLVNAARDAIAGGRQEVSQEELETSLAKNDQALADPRGAIALAKER